MNQLKPTDFDESEFEEWHILHHATEFETAPHRKSLKSKGNRSIWIRSI